MIYVVTYKKGGKLHAMLIDAKCARDAEIFFKWKFKEEVVGISEDTEDLHKCGASVLVVPDDFEAVFPVTYEDMENYVRKQIENSWDFVEMEEDDYVSLYMRVGIQGKYEFYVDRVRWLAGEKAEEEIKKKSILEAESVFDITKSKAASMKYSDDGEERETARKFFDRVQENKGDFWEPEYMAAMDEPETEENIKKLAADLWKQWKEYELDE